MLLDFLKNKLKIILIILMIFSFSIYGCKNKADIEEKERLINIYINGKAPVDVEIQHVDNEGLIDNMLLKITQEVGPSIKAEAWVYCEMVTEGGSKYLSRIIDTGNTINDSSINNWDGVTSVALVGDAPTNKINISCRGVATIITTKETLSDEFKLFRWSIHPSPLENKTFTLSKEIIFGDTITIY